MTKEDFLKGASNWNNHIFLLWPALEITSGDVIELGMGDGSTPQLHEYCKATNRRLFSFDNNLEWVRKFEQYKSRDHIIQYVTDWDTVHMNFPTCDVLLLDSAPGERRKIDLYKYMNSAKIIVAHDTEPAADHGYQMRNVLMKFKYMQDYQTPGAWASIVSMTIDVNAFHV